MNLTEMFYGKFQPPVISQTLVHKIGLTGLGRYIPPKKPTLEVDNRSDEEKLSLTAKKILNILRKQKKPISCEDMSIKSGFTKNHCSVTMFNFTKIELAKRMKLHKPGNHYYVYVALEKKDA